MCSCVCVCVRGVSRLASRTLDRTKQICLLIKLILIILHMIIVITIKIQPTCGVTNVYKWTNCNDSTDSGKSNVPASWNKISICVITVSIIHHKRKKCDEVAMLIISFGFVHMDFKERHVRPSPGLLMTICRQ